MRQTFKLATVAAALVVSCSLPYATRANVDNLCGLNMPVKQAGFDMPAAPVEFLAISRKVIADTQRTSFAATAPIEFVALSLELFPKTTLPGYDVTAPGAALPSRSAERSAHARQINSNAVSPLGRAALQDPAHSVEGNVDQISFDTPTLAPMAFVRFCHAVFGRLQGSPYGVPAQAGDAH